MAQGRRTAQTPFEQDDEFTVEKIVAKKLVKVAIEGSQTQVKYGKRQVKAKESVLHYEVKWLNYEQTTWEPSQRGFFY